MSKKGAQILLKDHVDILNYAKLLNVTRRTVYKAITDGRIVPDLVGKQKIKMIDMTKYGLVEFKINNGRVSNNS